MEKQSSKIFMVGILVELYLLQDLPNAYRFLSFINFFMDARVIHF
jgi:hypothetical protein